MISDQFNNRVVEINENGKIVWSFGRGPTDFSANSIIGVNDAQRVGDYTLMVGTGTPPNIIPQSPGGATDNRVILVSENGQIVWQYGQFGQTGDGFNLLNTPVQATWLPNQHVLITDQGNNRVIEVNEKKNIVWQFPGPNTNPGDQLSSPNSAQLLENGHILIADQGRNRAIEVTRHHRVVRIFTAGGTVGAVAFASGLKDGQVLLTDSSKSRIVQVDRHDRPVWQFYTDTEPLSVPNSFPNRAVRIRHGRTLIADQFNNRVIIVSEHGVILKAYGKPMNGGGTVGTNVGYDLAHVQNGLYGPSDAKMIGVYKGLTPPFSWGSRRDSDSSCSDSSSSSSSSSDSSSSSSSSSDPSSSSSSSDSSKSCDGGNSRKGQRRGNRSHH